MTSNRVRALLIVLFLGSGCSALIYELVWFQLLGLVIGVSSVSLGILLATFMGGMCLGSLLLPRVIPSGRHPLKVYAWIELGIGLCGIVLLLAMPLLGFIYFGAATSGPAGLAIRGLVAAVCLLPPTILMGATLPAIARWVESTPAGVSWLGLFYGGNIAGAVLGTVVAGFYLLRVHDVAVATYVAAAINVAVASAALATARMTAHDERGAPRIFAVSTAAWPVYVTIALSGVTALASEVLWTRHLSLFVGATVYGFALILAVFLLGLGLGSTAGSLLARRLGSARTALAGCQMLLCFAMAWAAFAVTQTLPYWPIDPTATMPWSRVGIDLVRSAWAMLPAAVLWGASFPLALAAAAAPGLDSGRLVGGLYAANTLGAIVGALGAGFVLVPWIGSQTTQRILIGLAAAAAVLMLVWAGGPARRKLAAAATAALIAVSLALALSVPPLRGGVVAWGRYLPNYEREAEVVYLNEGLTASIAVTLEPGGLLNYHNSGKVQASSYPQDMRLQRMLGHLTTLVPERRENFLVIGLGAGVTAGAVSLDPGIERVTIAEIEPLVPEVVSQYFGEFNFDVVDNPRVEIRIDDGRHFLQTTDQTFDGITSDPLDPWVKGAAALYTREFWQLAKARLNPGGAVTVFVQLYESTEDAVRSEIATFFDVFPNGAVFGNTLGGEGYDLVLLGMADDQRVDVSRMIERLGQPEYAPIRRSLAEVRIASAIDLLGTFAGQAADLSAWLAGADINTDRNMRLQYLAGMGVNMHVQAEIYDDMLANGVEFPDGLFIGSNTHLEGLRRTIEARQGRF